MRATPRFLSSGYDSRGYGDVCTAGATGVAAAGGAGGDCDRAMPAIAKLVKAARNAAWMLLALVIVGLVGR